MEKFLKMMTDFENNNKETNAIFPLKYKLYLKEYLKYLQEYDGGAGFIGENSYLILWSKNEILEFNQDYAVEEFLTDIVLIGSNGGDIAYGINSKGEYIEVPFIGMDDDEVIVIADYFGSFIKYLYE